MIVCTFERYFAIEHVRFKMYAELTTYKRTFKLQEKSVIRYFSKWHISFASFLAKISNSFK